MGSSCFHDADVRYSLLRQPTTYFRLLSMSLKLHISYSRLSVLTKFKFACFAVFTARVPEWECATPGGCTKVGPATRSSLDQTSSSLRMRRIRGFHSLTQGIHLEKVSKPVFIIIHVHLMFRFTIHAINAQHILLGRPGTHAPFEAGENGQLKDICELGLDEWTWVSKVRKS